MKKTIYLILIAIASVNFGFSQEWMTSLDVAKRLALVQNKMLFVVWEEATEYEYPVVFYDENQVRYVTDLFEDESVNEVIWQYFVPVILYESTYEDLFKQIKDSRSEKYIKRFQDDGIKIMDANGNILNTGFFNSDPFNIVAFIARYRLNTSFLKGQLVNYAKKKNFNTTSALALKYLDYAVLVDKVVRKEVIDLAAVYMNEAKVLLELEGIENKAGFKERFELLDLKKEVILNNPRKVLRQLKKIDETSINVINQSLFSFLHYTAYKLLGDEKKAALWKTKVSLVDLKKAELIININS